ncbi:MAG: prolyl oligopeptidase family serine peptidase [Nocardioidaceae bacterium]
MGELTADLITSTWHPTDVRLSPDGSLVCWSAAPYGQTEEHGESALWVASVDGALPARRWTYGGNDTDPRWSPDGTRIAFRSDRKERGTHGLYLLHADGGEAEPVMVRERSVAASFWSPDGERIAFCCRDEPDEEDERRKEERDDSDVYGERRQYHRLLVVDVGSGEVTTLVDTDLHVVDVAWSPGGSMVAFTAQDTPELDELHRRSLMVVGADGGETRRLASGQLQDGLSWTGDGQALVYLSSHDPAPQSSFSAWSIGTADGSQPRCIGTRREEPACTVDVRPGDGSAVAIVVLEGLGSRLERSDVSTGERSLLWDADGDVDAFDVAGDTLAAVVAQGSGAPEVWAGTPDDLRQVSHHHQAWDDLTLGRVEDFAFIAHDGLELDGVLIAPSQGARPSPTVVLVHGGPYGRSGRWLHCHPLDWGQWLATAGYTVLMPNYRGGAGHGEAFAASARGDMGGAEWADVMAAVDTAVERGIADPDRLGIGGWSQGGFLTAWAVTHTDRFKAAVMGAGPTDWGAMAGLSDLPTFEGALGGDAPWDGPGPHRAAERSPISYAANRTTPLLILHGKQDERVPLGQATAFHRAMRSQPAPLEMVTYPREPHGISEKAHQVDLLRRVRDWYDRWLQPDRD